MISSSCCHQDEIIGETWSMAWNEYLSSLGMRWRSWSLGTNLTSTAGRCHEFAAFLFHFCITCAPNLFSEGDCFILADFVRHSPRNVGCLVQQFSQKTLVYCILPLNRGVFSFSSHHFLPTVWIKTYLKFPNILGASSFSPHFPLIFPSFSLVFVPKNGWNPLERSPPKRLRSWPRSWRPRHIETMRNLWKKWWSHGKKTWENGWEPDFQVFQPQKWGMNMNGSSVSLWNWSFEPSNRTNLHQQELNFFTLKNGDSSTTWD